MPEHCTFTRQRPGWRIVCSHADCSGWVFACKNPTKALVTAASLPLGQPHLLIWNYNLPYNAGKGGWENIVATPTVLAQTSTHKRHTATFTRATACSHNKVRPVGAMSCRPRWRRRARKSNARCSFTCCPVRKARQQSYITNYWVISCRAKTGQWLRKLMRHPCGMATPPVFTGTHRHTLPVLCRNLLLHLSAIAIKYT